MTGWSTWSSCAPGSIALELFADAFKPFDGQFRVKLTAAQVGRLRAAT